mmetsp:Transcript_8360/g.19731  ORF Transcript_8360/g.19731 Transcript_8360/m.19731 type:complete len:394 (-) Transcript_8360:284-1465(-)
MGCVNSSCFAGLFSPSAADVLVVGAGPAGISAVLALQRQKRSIFWVDPEFRSGRLTRYEAVPCNTKVDILESENNFRHQLLQHPEVEAKVAPALQQLVNEAQPLPGSTDPSRLGWTTLGACRKIYDAATSGAISAGGVSQFFGLVTRLRHGNGRWTATVAGNNGQVSDVKVCSIVLATGAEPKLPPLPNALSAEQTFDKDALQRHLRPSQRLAVLGNSHTAAVALAKLQEIAGSMDLHVSCFARRPPRYAEWLPEKSVYRYNSTGLKGLGAVFGRDCMVNGQEGWLQIKHLQDFNPDDFDWIIDCTGYVKSQLPPIDGVKVQDLPRDEASGALLGVPSGLFALGVPWGEAPGGLWGKGLEAEEGFKGEDSFVGFAMFFSRAIVIADQIQNLVK